MTIDPSIQNYVIGKGFFVSAVLTVLYFLSWRLSPSIWYAEFDPGNKRTNLKGYYTYLIVFFGTLLSLLIYFDYELIELPININQSTLFAVNILIFLIHVLVDLFIIDIIIYSKIKPAFMKLEGIDYKTSVFHHLNYSLRLMIVGGVFCFLASVIVTH